MGQYSMRMNDLFANLPLREADLLIRKRAEQSEIAANYVKTVDGNDFSSLCYKSSNGSSHFSHNGDAFNHNHNAPFIMVLVLAMGVAYGLENKVLLLEVKNSLVE